MTLLTKYLPVPAAVLALMTAPQTRADSIIRLQEWGVRNGKAVARPRDIRFEPGQFNNRTDRVQRVADNPHLETELVFDTLKEDFHAEVFFHPEPWIIELQN